MSESARHPRGLFWLIELGLLLRIGAADAVEWLATRRGTRCLFPDTDVYWQLGQAIRRCEPFEVSQWGVPHFALRTPGYPLFLAACQTLFGDRTLPARLAQAVLGALCVWIVFRLVLQATNEVRPALIAAALTACDPLTISLSSFLLSEAVFLPLMLLGLWGLAVLWRNQERLENEKPCRRNALIALGTGVSWGAAILVKPSWELFPPIALAVGMIARGRSRGRETLIEIAVVLLGAAVVMAPWWVRNERLFGRFVPTALWGGASLYDGLNPNATGGSDMRFLAEREFQGLSEEAQDATLTARALQFAREHPRRMLELALNKAVRYWSPWPSGEAVRSRVLAVMMAVTTVPVYLLVLIGLCERRRDWLTWLVLAGPVLVFACVHMIFVSSARYRLPGMVPAFGLAGIGACSLWAMVMRWRSRTGQRAKS